MRGAAESTNRASTEALRAVTEAGSVLQREIETSITNSVQAHRIAAETMGNAFREQLGDALNKTNQGINDSFDVLDKAMRDELTHVMNEMGRALGQIAGKFAEDYQRLVTEMGRIVSMRPGPDA